MTLVLVSASGDRRFRLPTGEILTVGREATADLPVQESAVSRRHAEVRARDNRTAEIRDLGSRNGTWVNGKRIRTADISIGDLVAFGNVELYLREESDAPRPESLPISPGLSQTLVRERRLTLSAKAPEWLAAQRLAQLVEVAQRLGSAVTIGQLLDKMISDLFETLDADRAAVLLADDEGILTLRVGRMRSGERMDSDPPRAIIDGVVSRKAALLTRDATDDHRTAGASVFRQAVRSAMATPLLSTEGENLGVLYIDNTRNADSFSEDDLDFLVAYAGIAAAGVEREKTAAELARASRIRENFERYFAPEIASRIAASEAGAVPGGDRRSVTVLFCDIRGFTAIAETLLPDAMALQLNEYFEAMVECVFRHEGALDKFIGDAVLAYWSSILADENPSLNAVRAAADMQRAMSTLNNRWKAEGRPVLDIGIGLHAGEAFVGNIGSTRRLEFTLIGDTVNVASRVCGLTPPGKILVTEAVRDALAETEAAGALAFQDTVLPDRRSERSIGLWSYEWDRS